MVVTKEIRDVAAMGLRDTQYLVGPLITMVDGPDFDFLWAERHQLIQGQVSGADLVAISQAQKLPPPEVDHIRAVLDGNGVKAFALDTKQDYGVETVWDKILNPDETAGLLQS